jgi:hypothetical protein
VASEVIFNHYYEIGAEEYKEQDRKEKARTAAGMGLIILSWLARRFYVLKKRIDKTENSYYSNFNQAFQFILNQPCKRFILIITG